LVIQVNGKLTNVQPQNHEVRRAACHATS
jgi:hypothetical protein